jgi:hypothetical protein
MADSASEKAPPESTGPSGETPHEQHPSALSAALERWLAWLRRALGGVRSGTARLVTELREEVAALAASSRAAAIRMGDATVRVALRYAALLLSVSTLYIILFLLIALPVHDLILDPFQVYAFQQGVDSPPAVSGCTPKASLWSGDPGWQFSCLISRSLDSVESPGAMRSVVRPALNELLAVAQASLVEEWDHRRHVWAILILSVLGFVFAPLWWFFARRERTRIVLFWSPIFFVLWSACLVGLAGYGVQAWRFAQLDRHLRAFVLQGCWLALLPAVALLGWGVGAGGLLWFWYLAESDRELTLAKLRLRARQHLTGCTEIAFEEPLRTAATAKGRSSDVHQTVQVDPDQPAITRQTVTAFVPICNHPEDVLRICLAETEAPCFEARVFYQTPAGKLSQLPDDVLIDRGCFWINDAGRTPPKPMLGSKSGHLRFVQLDDRGIESWRWCFKPVPCSIDARGDAEQLQNTAAPEIAFDKNDQMQMKEADSGWIGPRVISERALSLAENKARAVVGHTHSFSADKVVLLLESDDFTYFVSLSETNDEPDAVKAVRLKKIATPLALLPMDHNEPYLAILADKPYLYALDPDADEPDRLSEIEVSELGRPHAAVRLGEDILVAHTHKEHKNHPIEIRVLRSVPGHRRVRSEGDIRLSGEWSDKIEATTMAGALGDPRFVYFLLKEKKGILRRRVRSRAWLCKALYVR